MSSSAISIAALPSVCPTSAFSNARMMVATFIGVGADQERPQIMVDAGRIRLRGAGKDRPRRRLPPTDDAGVGADLDDGAGHRLVDVADPVPALHLQGPAHDVDGEAGYAQIRHRPS